MQDTIQDFWLVWRENGSGPTHKHDSEESARKEAERLARKEPDAIFCVMSLVAACRKTPVVQWTVEA